MVQSISPVKTHSFSQGATTFSITQKLRNLVSSIKNVFSRVLQYLCPFLFQSKAAPQSISMKKMKVQVPSAPQPPKPSSLPAQPLPLKKAKVQVQPAPQASSLPVNPPSQQKAPQEMDPSHTPQFLKHAETEVSGPSSEFVETPVRVASPGAELPSIGSTPLRGTSPEPISLWGGKSFDEVEQIIRNAEEEDPVPRLLSPVRGFSVNGVPEEEQKWVGSSNTLRLMAKAEKRAKERADSEGSDDEIPQRSPRIDQPKPRSKSELAEVFARSPRLEKPKELISESVYGTNGLKANSREVVYFHQEAIPKIFSLFENGEKVDREQLDEAETRGLLLYSDSEDDGKPLPFFAFVNALQGFEEVGKMRQGELPHMIGILKGATRNLPADSVLGVCIFDGDMEKSPNIYTAYIRFDSARREHDFYLLDPYGDEINPVISWHLLNEQQFLARFDQKNYKVMAFKKILNEEA